MTTIARFKKWIDPDPETGCWNWTGYHMKNGYASFSVKGQKQLIHRFAYAVWVGKIPDGLVIDHLCRNRGCCNPAHLEPVTYKENTRRGEVFAPVADINRAKTHCLRGHAFDEENTRVTNAGKRCCRACERIRRGMKRASSTD